MPSRERFDAFIAMVLSEDHVGAIRDFYAPDASMQENLGPRREGRETLMANEASALARVASVKSELADPPALNGDRAYIHWRFTFKAPDGRVRVIDEVALQRWEGEHVVEERFFYDPATCGWRAP